MDITYTQEFDAKQYGRLISKTVSFAMWYEMVAAWCLALVGLVVAFGNWIYNGAKELNLILFLFAFFPWLLILRRHFYVKALVKMQLRQMNGAKTLKCHLTNDCYEVTCASIEQKVTWVSLATHYHFFDNDKVSLTMLATKPVLVITNLADKGIGREAFEAVLRNAGLRRIYEPVLRRARAILLCAMGIISLLMTCPYFLALIADCENGIRSNYAYDRLMESIVGDDNCGQIPVEESLRMKIIRAIAGDDKPDDLLYVFDDAANDFKTKVLARYGDVCYEARYGGSVVIRKKSIWKEWDSMFGRVNPIVFREQQKDEWLRKVRACFGEHEE